MAEKIIVPAAIESERVVLGSIIVEGRDAMKKIAHKLTYKDFYDESHRYIYRAMERLFSDQTEIDVVTLHQILTERGYIDLVGGASYLTELGNSTATALHIVSHAKIVADRAALRNIIQAANDIKKMTQGDQDLEEVLEKAESRIKGVTREASKIEDKLGTVDLEEWRQIARDTEERDGQIHGLSTGLKGVDDMIEGFEPGEMMIITGHTKHGKSRLAANIAWNVANQGKSVYFINTEMTKLQMGRRFNGLAGTTKPKGKIILNDKAGLSYMDVIRIMEKAKEAGCDMVIVDHLHFFSRSVENQTSEISKIAKDFKDAAVEFELPLIMLCHLAQADTKKRPTLQMIKNSSSIAQDADIVLSVWLDDRPDSTADETEVLRLAHRSAEGTKKRTTLYNDGMKLVETPPPKPGLAININQVLGEKDAQDLDNLSW